MNKKKAKELEIVRAAMQEARKNSKSSTSWIVEWRRCPHHEHLGEGFVLTSTPYGRDWWPGQDYYDFMGFSVEEALDWVRRNHPAKLTW